MADHQWRDPLLDTDVSWQGHSSGLNNCADSMTDPNSPSEMIEDSSWKYQSLEDISAKKSSDPDGKNAVDGRSMLGFSLTSPDLVICTGSPDVPRGGFEDSPDFLGSKCHHNLGSSFELSLENGINGSELKETSKKTPTVRFSTVCQTYSEELSPEASFELFREEDRVEDVPKDILPVLTINVGSTEKAVVLGEENFSEDKFFAGGDTVRTSRSVIGDGDDFLLYQTARVGNFCYEFLPLEAGDYTVDLHFAEIVFTSGPPGMRVFDVYIQEEKVVSCLDVYARVGGNQPLVISGIKTSVEDDDKGLAIRFEGVTGKPILCGISMRKCHPASSEEVIENSEIAECNEIENSNGSEEEEYQKLRRECECQKKELTELRKAFEELKRENQLKTRECHEAWKSLEDLRGELMRKSMHVGSLAFAIEGQVKEKGKWFSSLRDLTRKLKIMKMEHIKLSEETLAYKNFLADMNEMKVTIQSTMSREMGLHEDLKIKFLEGVKERKQLYNKVLELKGNIRVFCRCRPLNSEEITAGDSMAIDFDTAKDGELIVKSNGVPKKTFRFDAVFGPQADQADVFEDTAPFATSVLDGYNVCIFAYGQTGTGKTFTMEGTDEARGVNFRTLNELFKAIRERENQYRFEISVSVLEVYNEQIRDLLVSNSQPGVAAKRLEIKQVSEGSHHVPGLVEANVSNMSEVWEVLQTGSNARAVGSTNANEHSSRSHCIHCVMVKGENLLNGECTKSKLWLVDLAGSERVAKTEVQGERLKETQNINRSLSALGDVISALATKSPHIPFRNSKLTHLLQDSLGGDSKTLMFVQISPSESDLSETLCSLNFASRVKGIELGPARKQLDTSELFKYKQTVEKTKQEMKSKDVQIRKLEETIQSMDLKMREKDLKYKNLQDKLKELESQLMIERKLARQHVDTKIAEQYQQQQMKQSEEQSSAAIRPPLANRLLSSKSSIESAHTHNNFKFPSLDVFVKQTDMMEKENNPEMAERLPVPKKTGRASMCTTARRPQIAPPQSRRNSLAPFPSSVHLTTPFSPLPPYQYDEQEDTDGSGAKCLPEMASSPKTSKSGTKKLSSILRRSMHKKIQGKSPMQQQARRGGVNVGMERVRVSIGARGRPGHRMLFGNGRRMGTKEVQLKQKEKERGWNTGTASRMVF